MENIGINNFISIVIGIFLVLLCCIISYLFQKHLFSKYKNKVKNIVDKDDKPIS
ncbi:hypothetical protein [Clostridium sp. BJN0013]|uniref:hypothetical protein n=1 Tax=Clostridium sp. BJN0013 TaxID=3236840 RepID=UPI0034C6B4EA